jgi:DNA-binding transcriptional ArsR family regulator
MFVIELNVDDLANARFTLSPLHELVGSLWPVYGRRGLDVHQRWGSRIRERPGIDHELLQSLVSPNGAIPDFIAPPPEKERQQLAAQLAVVRGTPPGKVISDLTAAYGAFSMPGRIRQMLDDAAGAGDLIADALEQYWNVAIAPEWQGIANLLESDLLHRGQQMAQAGASAAFAGLDPRIRWRDGTIQVDIVRQWRRSVPVAGRGLRLVPSIFAPYPHLPIDVLDPPVLAYPATAAGTLWQAPPRPSGTTQALLGLPRARLLAMLCDPVSTTELARRLDVTASAVSQHLKVLGAAGLVRRTRVGRLVLYQRTGTGSKLSDAGSRETASKLDR